MEKNLGVLCHISSLPSKYGVGDFGKSSFEFIDFLSKMGINIWQILPINLTNKYNYPYSSPCSFSIDEMFVDVDSLMEANLINYDDLNNLRELENTPIVDFQKVKSEKYKVLEKAYKNISNETRYEMNEYVSSGHEYILMYAYFRSLLEKFNVLDWRDLPEGFEKISSPGALKFLEDNFDLVQKYVFYQWLLESQWQKVREYANNKGIIIYGDMPIYPDKNSADVYFAQEFYKLDENTKLPKVTGGVPPDAFSKTGQNWGTCIYNWDEIKKGDYDYIINKIKMNLSRFDCVRLDHVTGLVEHYEVNNEDPSKSEWVKGGGEELFRAIDKKCGLNRIFIEDLGILRDDTRKVKQDFGLIGMSVLEMALFNDQCKQYLPQNVPEYTIYYLGTHDNDTIVGYINSLTPDELKEFCGYVGGKDLSTKNKAINCMRQVYRSKAGIVIFQMQDYLLQGSDQRMNIPGRETERWFYKVPSNYQKQFEKTLSDILKENFEFSNEDELKRE